MGDERLTGWMDRYVGAWTSNDPQEIGGLFTEDAVYYTAPWREPWVGREGIVAGWLGRKDEQGNWRFRWEPIASSDDLHFIRGWTEYLKESTRYSNLWVIRLESDGRCSEFTEWWMLEN
jgi:hypothetical protein